MADEVLVQQVNDLLINSPLSDEEVSHWQRRLPYMNNQQATDLLRLLKDRLAILEASNNLLIKMAEDADKYDQEIMVTASQARTFLDVKIETLINIFGNHLVEVLIDKDFDLFEDLDEYFLQENALKDEVQSEFRQLTDALLNNREILLVNQTTVRATIGVWLHDYLIFSSDQTGLSSGHGDHSLRRINFVNQNELAKRLPDEDKSLLLKLLKLYDFLMDTSIEMIETRQEQQTEAEEDLEKLKQHRINLTPPLNLEQPILTTPVLSTPQVDKNQAQIAETEALLARYPEGSLERLALEEELIKLRQ